MRKLVAHFSALSCAILLVVGVPGHARPFAHSLVSPTLPTGWIEPIFGFELTFVGSPPFKGYMDQLNRRLAMAREAERRLGISRDGHPLEIPITSTKSLSFGTDPEVIEVTGTPDTVAGYSLRKALYQDVVFESGRAVGLIPHEIVGGGHIHIGRVFVNNDQLLRDFYVDMVNHPSLFAGIFSYNPKQGKIVADRGVIALEAYVEAIAKIDRLIRSHAPSKEIFECLVDLQGWERTWSVNLKNLSLGNCKQTVELRIAPQKTFADFLSTIKFLRARILFLMLNPNQEVRLNPGPETFQQAQAEFKEMINETGLDWNEYEHFGIKSGRMNPEMKYRERQFSFTDIGQLKAAADVAKIERDRLFPESTRDNQPQQHFDQMSADALYSALISRSSDLSRPSQMLQRPQPISAGWITRVRRSCERMLIGLP